jgi:hypothetical protein
VTCQAALAPDVDAPGPLSSSYWGSRGSRCRGWPFSFEKCDKADNDSDGDDNDGNEISEYK